MTANGDRQLRRLRAVTDTELARLDIEDLLAELAARARAAVGADTSTILLLDQTGRELVATAASGLAAQLGPGVRIPVGTSFAGRIAATTEPLVIEVDAGTVLNRSPIDEGLSVLAGVPITASGKVLGVLHVGSRDPRQFSDDDLDLLRVVADRAGMAAQARNARLERQATVALQRSLLPARPPHVAGLDVAAHYLPGAEVGVGGDWYDLFTLPSGQVGVAIGDVAGSGLRAAVVMGRIRSALRAYAIESEDPADVLTRLDRKIQLFEPDAFATAIYAVIDPSRSTMTASVAGHLPPILLDPVGAPRELVVTADLPLGAYPNAPRHSVTLPFPDALLLYTDGLIERRGRPLDVAIKQLLETLTGGTADELCAQVMALVHGDPVADDIALLAICRTD
ncbi:MAG TPA: GAF domain-containing SpoIIE family protein phosphatase [Natronosporangium sp.]